MQKATDAAKSAWRDRALADRLNPFAFAAIEAAKTAAKEEISKPCDGSTKSDRLQEWCA